MRSFYCASILAGVGTVRVKTPSVVEGVSPASMEAEAYLAVRATFQLLAHAQNRYLFSKNRRERSQNHRLTRGAVSKEITQHPPDEG